MKSLLKKVRKDKKGFTLAELLVVVAIIGVLVAISIPIFTAQLEKSREAVDMANIRAAYAEIAAEALTDDTNAHSTTVNFKQTETGWKTDNDLKIAGVPLSNINVTVGGNVEVKYDNTTRKVTIAGENTASDYTIN